MSEIPLDASGRIDTDVQCVGCDYNLRGLDDEAVCPECGIAVDQSVRGDFLQFANPEWLMSLAMGMSWAFGSLAAVVACGLFAAGCGSFIGDRELLSVMILGITTGTPIMCAFVACWLFSMPEPHAVNPDPSPNWRKIARVSAIVLVSAIFLMGVAAFVFPVLGINNALGENFFVVCFLVCLVASVIGYFSAGRYAVGLARRIPDKHLASHTNFVTIGGTLVGLSICFAIMLAISSPSMANLFSFVPTPPGRSLPVFLEIVIAVGGLVTLVGGCVMALGVLILMFRFHGTLHEIAATANRRTTVAISTASLDAVKDT